VWLTTNSIISGFALYGGATRATPQYNSATYGGGVFGASKSAIAANCLIISNAAVIGGGAEQLTLNDCTIAANVATGSGNEGGGADHCNLLNCIVTANTASGSSTSAWGGGVSICNLTNCAVTRNSSPANGGGAYLSTLINCTVTGNQVTSSASQGGGVASSTLVNCIVYLNQTLAFSYLQYSNSYGSSFSYSCTAPAAGGTGNIASNPLLLGDGIHLSSASPCIHAGTASVAFGTDIDGQPWNNPPSMGCDEWQPAPQILNAPAFQFGVPAGGSTLGVSVSGQMPFTCFWTLNGSPIQDNGHFSNSGTPNLAINGFGPGDAGLYQVVVSNAFGIATSTVAPVVIHAVNAAGANPVAPYSSWATAATNIQDAINSAAAGDIVLVTNGIYANGGLIMAGDLINRVALNKPITVTSVNGYLATVIQGAWDPSSKTGPGAVRCVYVSDGALLNGFTLLNGATRATGDSGMGGPLESGGGVWSTSTNAIVSNCVFTNNTAIYGGGAAYGTLNNSLVINNSANYGGGAYSSTLNNCTVVENNSALSHQGAGTYSAIVENSIVYANYASQPPLTLDNYYCLGQPQYAYSDSSSSTLPLPSGAGNTSADPQYLDWYHLASTSPCRGAGSSAYSAGTDLDGQPWNNPPSMGCSEVVLSNLVGPLTVNLVAPQTNPVINRYVDLYGYFTGHASTIGWSFGDGGMATNTWASGHFWTKAGNYTVTFTVYNEDNPAGVSTNIAIQVQPLNPPQMQSGGIIAGTFQFQFSGQTNVNYTVQYTTNLAPPISWQMLQTIFFNQAGTVQIDDPAWTNGTRFYRVLAQ
jgi:hypothetical protein